MPKKRSWTDEELEHGVKIARSYRAVLIQLKLVPAGGNYVQVKRRIRELELDTSHFTGMGWNGGMRYVLPHVRKSLDDILVVGSDFQSHKLKKRLIEAGMKAPMCEICGWGVMAPDGRIPVELDHINGDRYDNRLENLRILCPNCHSLQPTHRGKNKKVGLTRA